MSACEQSTPRYLVTGGSGFIGTNLIQALLDDGAEVINLDAAAPLAASQQPVWQQVDLLDAPALRRSVADFAPTHVIHLAARADCDGRTLDDYRQNIDGTQNLLEAVRACSSVQRLVITSTQFVCQPGYLPAHDEDFHPHTVYGQSKVLTEKLTRQADLDCVWTIIRPTTIWGPWLLRHKRQVFRTLRWGLYIHPGPEPVLRSWGYVGNVVFQVRQLLAAPAHQVHREVFYVGDEPLNLLDWVNGFSLRMRGKKVRIAPRALVRWLGFGGDCLMKIGIKAPLTTSRFRSMTQDYLTPMKKTLDLVGTLPFTLDDGIEETLQWLDDPSAGRTSSNRRSKTETLASNG